RRHTRFSRDWSSDVCSSDLLPGIDLAPLVGASKTIEQIQLTGPREELVVPFHLEEGRTLHCRGIFHQAVAIRVIGPPHSEHRSEIGRASCRERVSVALEPGP